MAETDKLNIDNIIARLLEGKMIVVVKVKSGGNCQWPCQRL